MEKLTKIVVDCSTGISQIVELSEEELADRELNAKEAQKRREEQNAQDIAKAAAKASAEAKLAALGLTAEEIAAL